MFKDVLVWVVGCVLCTALYANTTANDFPAIKAYAKSLSQTPMSTMKKFNPSATFEHYNESPAEMAYYKESDADKVDLTSEATNAIQDDVGGKTVLDNVGKHQFEINKNNPDIQHAMHIEAESYAITHSISTNRVSCKSTSNPQCTPTSHEELCSTSRQLPEQQCLKKRVVSVASEKINQAIQVVVTVHKNFKGLITINLVTGSITNAVNGSLSSRLLLHHACQSMSTTVHSINNNHDRATWAHVIGLPTCENNGLLTLQITQSYKRDYPLQIALTASAITHAFEAEEHWDNACMSLETKAHEGICHIKEESCTDRRNPRIIDGLPVTRDCWETTVTYNCNSAKADECQTQIARGCLQIASRCTSMGSACDQYEQVYKCIDTKCPPEFVCTHDVFCADGECVDKVASQSTDVGQSMAALAATDASGREYSATQATLFGGNVRQCKIWLLNLIDCCSDKGWGKAIHLLNCRPEDKQLGEAKLNYLAHYLGKFCATEELGVCVEHKRSYCVFNSKMARIMQEEGRLKQLNAAALGSAEHPTCAGMSVAELQQLDMSKINFINPVYPAAPASDGEPLKEAGIVGDVPSNLPNADKALDEITRRVQKKVGG
jgi:conjugal transfer mating pair stabilization protein TraN